MSGRGHDLTSLDPDILMPDLPPIDDVGTRSGQMLELAKKENWTLRQLYQHFAAARGHMVLIGTPSMVADTMEEWVNKRALLFTHSSIVSATIDGVPIRTM